jgi:hypothetical protein
MTLPHGLQLQRSSIVLKSRRFVIAAALAAVPLAAARADFPGRHPRYLHALSDLRTARWLLAHPSGDAAINFHENAAIQQIDAAIRELNQAAIDDGKNVNERPPVDVPIERGPGRLHKAHELINGARADLFIEEDNPEVLRLRHRAVEHVDRALQETNAAIWDLEHQG